MIPTLIYCADGNRRFAEIALRHGYRYGACLPNTVYFDPSFTDQDWRKFNTAKSDEHRAKLRSDYMTCLERYRPALATVLDWERPDQLSEVLSWAEQAAQYVEDSVIIIPKVIGGVKQLPRTVGGKPVRLGYSAASTFSGTPVSISEFRGWPVHCLGAGPAVQMDLARRLDVQSADGNYIQQLARKYCQFYSPGHMSKNRHWPRLREFGAIVEWDAPYVAFELTCIAVPMAWRGASGPEILAVQLEFLRDSGFMPKSVQIPMFTIREEKAIYA